MKKKTGRINLLFVVLYFVFIVGIGLLNQDSSRTLWIVIPYFCMFLPLALFAGGAYTYWHAALPMTPEVYKASIVRMRHSIIGMLGLAGLNIILDIIFIIRHFSGNVAFNTTVDKMGQNTSLRLSGELIYIGGFLILIGISIAFAKVYDKYYTDINGFTQ